MTLAMMILQAAEPVESIRSINSEAFSYFKFFFIFGGVLVLAYVTVRVWMPKLSGLRSGSAGPIQVIGRLSIEPRKTLYVVRTGQESFLIGTSEADIHFLTAVNISSTDLPIKTL